MGSATASARGIIAITIATLGACGIPSSPRPASGVGRKPVVASAIVLPSATASVELPVASASASADAGPAQIDPDGDDDPEDPGTGEVPAAAHFERVGRSKLSLRQVCDLTVLGDVLYSAQAFQPLGLDGATIVAYRSDAEPKQAFSVAFDWNRIGEKQEGGGAGQGFLRVHRIDGRLFVPDADPPYAGLGLVEFGAEGYVFISDREGKFAPARYPNHRPPGPPDAEGKAGAGVLPRAYHVIDTIRFRGRYYASTGSVPPKQAAWSGPAPGALHAASADLSRWTYEIDYPFPWLNGVWRLTYMVRFKDKLYVGIQDYDGVEPNDYLVFDPPPGSTTLERSHLRAVRVTAAGAAQTVRWYAQDGKLYWIAASHEGTQLRVTEDGLNWQVLGLPSSLGRPTDIKRFRNMLVVMTERALVKLDGTVIAQVNDAKSPFAVLDLFCTAPLGVYRNELYVGGQRDGALYKVVAGEK